MRNTYHTIQTNVIKPILAKKTIVFLFVVAIALVSILILFYINAQKVKSAGNWVEHTQDVLRKSNDVFVDIITIESSARGYMLSGNDMYIAPLDANIKEIHINLEELKTLTKDNAAQQLRIELLKDEVDDKLTFNNSMITLRKQNEMKELETIMNNGKGRIQTETLRRIITDINIEEFRLLRIRKYDKVESNNNSTILFCLLLLLVAFVFVLLIFIVKAQNAKNKIAEKLSKTTDLFLNLFNYNPASIAIKCIADGKIVNVNYSFLQLYNFATTDEVIGKTSDELNISIEQKYEVEIAKQLSENKILKDFEINIYTSKGERKWISASAMEMEVDTVPCLFSVSIDITNRKIAEDELITVNKELEAFTYSVSHDLRAPLRAINGYAKIIQEDYSPVLDVDGMSSLAAIMNNSRKMGELIDDLLAFSRLGRKVVESSEINMSSLVTSVREEEMHGNTSDIEFIIKELLPAQGQQALIKQVWINLISNAIKYSHHKPKTIIEIGSYMKDYRVAYYVKDNGAGFDMQYYDKLFGVFQRLHSQEEFEGTGIGLAIVKKIINRHNGNVWAESKLNEGACFSFSLLPITKN